MTLAQGAVRPHEARPLFWNEEDRLMFRGAIAAQIREQREREARGEPPEEFDPSTYTPERQAHLDATLDEILREYAPFDGA